MILCVRELIVLQPTRRTVTPTPAAASLPVCVCPTINFKDTGRTSDTNTACTKDCLLGCQNIKPGGICKIGCQTPLNRTRTNADGSYVCKTTGYEDGPCILPRRGAACGD
jgi:hypothetical protein